VVGVVWVLLGQAPQAVDSLGLALERAQRRLVAFAVDGGSTALAYDRRVSALVARYQAQRALVSDAGSRAKALTLEVRGVLKVPAADLSGVGSARREQLLLEARASIQAARLEVSSACVAGRLALVELGGRVGGKVDTLSGLWRECAGQGSPSCHGVEAVIEAYRSLEDAVQLEQGALERACVDVSPALER
jgi:hypothetical protein